jgi:hypothetical protein
MGWNCTIALVHGATLGDLASIGWTPTSTSTTWQEATVSSFQGIAAWERDGTLVLASGDLELIGAHEALATLGPAYVAIFGSVSDTWVLMGPTDEHLADEDALFERLAAVGLTYDERLEEASFVVLDTPSLTDDAPPPRRRKRFGIF